METVDGINKIDFKNPGKYYIKTFGCQMNVHDSEKIAHVLEDLNYKLTDDMRDADLIVFNTCCIRDTAEKKAYGHIGAIKKLKAKKPNLIVAVVGCLAQQHGSATKIRNSYPYVDIILGTNLIFELRDLIRQVQIKRRSIVQTNLNWKPCVEEEEEEAKRTSYPHAWINITYGCNNFCTYCVVPYVRGKERSRDIKNILEEIKDVLKQGYKEIILLGQNVNSYGSDFPEGTNINFATLLREIDKINKKFRVRFMTSHPKDLTKEVIDIIAKSDKLCKSIHLPLQSGSNEVLFAMNRKYTREKYLETVKYARKKIKDCPITTDIMVGFPNETEECFQETLDMVKKVRFQSAFTYIYSIRKGTVAAGYKQIPYAIKSARVQKLIALQKKITDEIAQQYVGNTYEVLCDGFLKNRKDYLEGKTDSGKLVTFKGTKDLIGEFVKVKIKSAHLTILKGELVK